MNRRLEARKKANIWRASARRSRPAGGLDQALAQIVDLKVLLRSSASARSRPCGTAIRANRAEALGQRRGSCSTGPDLRGRTPRRCRDSSRSLRSLLGGDRSRQAPSGALFDDPWPRPRARWAVLRSAYIDEALEMPDTARPVWLEGLRSRDHTLRRRRRGAACRIRIEARRKEFTGRPPTPRATLVRPGAPEPTTRCASRLSARRHGQRLAGRAIGRTVRGAWRRWRSLLNA